MAYEQKEGNGSLFKNKYKAKEGQPDYKGNIKINGVEIQLVAYLNDYKDGKYLKIIVDNKPKKEAFTPRGNDEMPKDELNDVPF
jgi:hypothetical protein